MPTPAEQVLNKYSASSARMTTTQLKPSQSQLKPPTTPVAPQQMSKQQSQRPPRVWEAPQGRQYYFAFGANVSQQVLARRRLQPLQSAVGTVRDHKLFFDHIGGTSLQVTGQACTIDPGVHDFCPTVLQGWGHCGPCVHISYALCWSAACEQRTNSFHDATSHVFLRTQAARSFHQHAVITLT